MDGALQIFFAKLWELLNLGIEVNGFAVKFWYLPAFFILIDMPLVLFNFKSSSAEKTGSTGKYKRKGGESDD